MKKILTALKVPFIVALVIASVVLIAVWGTAQKRQTENELWNEGVCDCGGHYQLFDIERTRGDEYYYYKCDKCNGIFKSTHCFKYEN